MQAGSFAGREQERGPGGENARAEPFYAGQYGCGELFHITGQVIIQSPENAGENHQKARERIKYFSVIYNDVKIGDNTLIGDNASIREQCRIGNNCIIGRNVTLNYNVLVGDSTKILDGSVITGNMKIGDNVFISALVATTNDNNIGKLGYDESFIKGPVIEDNVSIGAGANILPSIKIGENSIVGAGAVVTKDVPPKKLVIGIPAKIVRNLK